MQGSRKAGSNEPFSFSSHLLTGDSFSVTYEQMKFFRVIYFPYLLRAIHWGHLIILFIQIKSWTDCKYYLILF